MWRGLIILSSLHRKFVVASVTLSLGMTGLSPGVSASSAERDSRAGLPDLYWQSSSSSLSQIPGFAEAPRTSCGCNDDELLTISPTATPTISGTAAVRKTLTARTTGWMTGLTFRYKWLRNGASIAGATGSTYTVKAADKRKRISVEVTATKDGYKAKSLTSAPTRAVKR